MYITRETPLGGRDFEGEFTCEHCGNEQSIMCYDDSYFRTNVIPTITCTSCGRDRSGYIPREANPQGTQNADLYNEARNKILAPNRHSNRRATYGNTP